MEVRAAIERGVEELHRQRAAAARRAKARLGPRAKGGKRRLWTAEQLAKVKPIYFDLSLTQPEIVVRTGIPYRTLHRAFGARGAKRGRKA
jgi:hypothetical protein